MDPDEALRLLRKKVAAVRKMEKECKEDGACLPEQKERLVEIAQEFTELVEGLDEWLSKKGFLPRAWQR